ncbi:hypothetical protein J6590_054701 [Homalodisca vitripennis]|nr:hypothetical protein J6590_054701 [Homalodisca vitripennis]
MNNFVDTSSPERVFYFGNFRRRILPDLQYFRAGKNDPAATPRPHPYTVGSSALTVDSSLPPTWPNFLSVDYNSTFDKIIVTAGRGLGVSKHRAASNRAGRSGSSGPPCSYKKLRRDTFSLIICLFIAEAADVTATLTRLACPLRLLHDVYTRDPILIGLVAAGSM